MVMSEHLDMFTLSRLLFFALIFFPLTLWFGPIVLKKIIRWFAFSSPWEAKLLASFIFVMCFSWLAAFVQMSTIIGAFMAGIILHDGFFESRERALKNPLSIKNLLSPFEAVFAPIFFMLVGMQVKLETFCNSEVMVFAGCLIGVAILGKLISGLGGNKGDDRLMIGIGMLPRGEVGLVFASVGQTIGVISETLFSAIVVMIVVTTFITPLWLKSRYRMVSKHHG
jgi:Kef-type K+ transport system membrane component KefB